LARRETVGAIRTCGRSPVDFWNGKDKIMQAAPPPVITQEIRIVDEKGRPRLTLSAQGGQPAITMTGPDGAAGFRATLDATGRPSIRLDNPNASGPTAAIEVDDKGAHVKFDRPGGASSYLFLNNAGVSGMVLVDPKGVRRLNIVLGDDGAVSIIRFADDGKPLP
jgi:hypothetical protein